MICMYARSRVPRVGSEAGFMDCQRGCGCGSGQCAARGWSGKVREVPSTRYYYRAARDRCPGEGWDGGWIVRYNTMYLHSSNSRKMR